MMTLAFPTTDPVTDLHSQISELFEDFAQQNTPWNLTRRAGSYPAVNLWEQDDAAHLEAELPGVNIEDVEILATGNQLTLNVQVRAPEESGKIHHRRERLFGRFSRTLSLPWDINTEAIHAQLKNGMLHVDLPKAESSKPRKITLVTA